MIHTESRTEKGELAARDWRIPLLPKVIRIEPAASCNLRCIHCATGTSEGEDRIRGIMSKTTFSNIMSILEKHKHKPGVAVLYHGGEPLLNNAFADFILALKSWGVPHVKTVSNGTLLTRQKIYDIVRAGLDAIEFSLDGRTPRENDAIRVGASCEQIIRNIKRLLDVREELGFSNPQVFIANTQIADANNVGDGTPDGTPVMPDYLTEEFSGKYTGRVGFKLTYAIFWPGLKTEQYGSLQVPKGEIPEERICDHVMNTMTIRWNGDIVPCCYDIRNDYVIGNIHDAPLMDLWNNKRYRALRQTIVEKQYLPLCRNCHVVNPNLYLNFGTSRSRIQEWVKTRNG